jgi:cytosine/uracil/thiamine/allantoin permease
VVGAGLDVETTADSIVPVFSGEGRVVGAVAEVEIVVVVGADAWQPDTNTTRTTTTAGSALFIVAIACVTRCVRVSANTKPPNGLEMSRPASASNLS